MIPDQHCHFYTALQRRPAASTCSVDLQRRPAAQTCSLDLQLASSCDVAFDQLSLGLLLSLDGVAGRGGAGWDGVGGGRGGMGWDDVGMTWDGVGVGPGGSGQG